MFADVKSLGINGLNAFEVDVEIDISRGMPLFSIVGLPDTAIKESRERIRSALKSSGINIPPASIMVNLAPAGTKKSGSMYDMAILVAVIRAMGIVRDNLENSAFIGEVSLGGGVRPVNGILPMAIQAKELGIKEIFLPKENAYEASVAKGVKIYGVENINQLVNHLCGQELMKPQEAYLPPEASYEGELDFADVKGQYSAKKALEIAAAGGHNALMVGPPGSGKSMLAQRLPSILPPLSFEESLETTNIYSVAGIIDPKTPLVVKRPFRSPHSTASKSSLIGGGNIPHPGEISLAHNGVLFIDEMPEFEHGTLESLRQPLEEGTVTISRVSGNITYPCSIMLIGAMNPCPCGYYGHPSAECRCSDNQISRYISRVSGPLLERIDLHIEVAPVGFSDIASPKKGEPSSAIRERVMRAREIQKKRFKGTDIRCNADLKTNIDEYFRISGELYAKTEEIFNRLNMSARVYQKLWKISRTIADLEGSDDISERHIFQAVQYRSLDRKYWFSKS